MAHVINPIDIKPRNLLNNKIKTLSCLPECIRKTIHDADGINERIQKAAKVKQQLEADIFERENNIKQSSIASQNI